MEACWWLAEFDYEDDVLEDGIMMWDLEGIKKKRKNDAEAKQSKIKLLYQAEPYMKGVVKSSEIDLSSHVGMYKPTVPAFGFPVINFHEDPVEKHKDSKIHSF